MRWRILDDVAVVRAERGDGRRPEYRCVGNGVDGPGRLRGWLTASWSAPGGATEHHRAPLEQLTGLAATRIGELRDYQRARDLAAYLEIALHSRGPIEQAKRILMERYRLIAEHAFDLLARVSMHTNRKLRDIAEQLVLTGALPGQERAASARHSATTDRLTSVVGRRWSPTTSGGTPQPAASRISLGLDL